MSNMPAKRSNAEPAKRTKVLALPTLDKDNYDTWDKMVKHTFFAEGWIEMYNKSLTEDKKDDKADDADRRLAWGCITGSLQGDMVSRIDKVPLGEVEELLRCIRSRFYRKTANSKSELRQKLHGARLEDHADLETYITYIEKCVSRLAEMGKTIDDEDKLFYLLKGLPADYDATVAVINIPRPEGVLSWDQAVHMLRDRAQNPNVAGSISLNHGNKRKDTVLTSKHQQGKEMPVCRDFAKGRCRRKNCRFRHVDQPRPKCSYCGKPNHTADKCFKKQREQKEQSSNSTTTPKPETTSYVQEATTLSLESCFPVRHELRPLPLAPSQPITNREKISLEAALIATAEGPKAILIDGGSTCGVVEDESMCNDVVNEDCKIEVGGGELMSSRRGNFTFYTRVGEQTHKITIKNVRIVPGFGRTLIAENQFVRGGCKIVLGRGLDGGHNEPREGAHHIEGHPGCTSQSAAMVRQANFASSCFKSECNECKHADIDTARNAPGFWGFQKFKSWQLAIGGIAYRDKFPRV